MWSNNPSKPDLGSKNLIVKVGLQLWDQYKKTYNLISQTPPPAYDRPASFQIWIDQNLTRLDKFLLNSKFTSFSHLQANYHIPVGEFYHFLQIRHFFQQHYTGPNSDSNTLYENLCHTSPHQKGLISGGLQTFRNSSTLTYRVQWERELCLEDGDLDWAKGWQNMRSCQITNGSGDCH